MLSTLFMQSSVFIINCKALRFLAEDGLWMEVENCMLVKFNKQYYALLGAWSRLYLFPLQVGCLISKQKVTRSQSSAVYLSPLNSSKNTDSLTAMRMLLSSGLSVIWREKKNIIINFNSYVLYVWNLKRGVFVSRTKLTEAHNNVSYRAQRSYNGWSIPYNAKLSAPLRSYWISSTKWCRKKNTGCMPQTSIATQ